MRFSIIVPVYNVEKYLAQCLDSILAQTYSDFELIIVDDGSPDNCGKICDEYAKNDSRIKVIHQKNQGLSGARNTGLDHATGEWVLFIDSDDWIESGLLETIAKQISKTNADVYAYNVKKVSDDGKEVIEKLVFFPEYDLIIFKDEAERFSYYRDLLLQYKVGWEAWNKVFKREIIEENKLRFQPTKEYYAEDLLFTLQYYMHVKRVGYVCDLFYNYRQRSGSLLDTRKLETILPRLSALSDYFYAYLIENKRKEFIADYYQLYFHLMNHHIRYPLKDVDSELIFGCLTQLMENKNHRLFVKKIKKNLYSFRKFMVNVVWL